MVKRYDEQAEQRGANAAPDVSELCEYFFECRVDRVSSNIGGLSENDKPQIYLEREYGGAKGSYVLYAVFPLWLSRDGKGKGRAENYAPPYDRARILFDRDGISPMHMQESPEVDIRTEYTDHVNDTEGYSHYRNNGYRADILRDSNGMYEFSGTGRIVCSHSGKKELSAEYVFYVNYTFRRKICYTTKISGSKLSVSVSLPESCKNDIPVKVLVGDGRVPCLASDERNASEKRYLLELSKSKGKKWEGEFTVDGLSGMKAPHCLLAFADKEDEKHYLLEYRAPVPAAEHGFRRSAEIVCPYCHEKISFKEDAVKLYRKGGVSCDGTRILSSVRGETRGEQRNCIYCKKDITPEGKFVTNYNRLLPTDYLSRESFNIALYGSRRAGKTTFLSRLFNLRRNRENLTADCAFLLDVLSGIRLKAYHPPKVSSRDKDVRIDPSNPYWAPAAVYGNYVMETGEGHFPRTTEAVVDEDSLYKSPFIMSAGSKAYVNFYDISGEDAENGRMHMMGDAGNLGIFLIVDIESTRSEGNKNVIRHFGERIEEELVNIKNKDDIPVAVIVTKFDKHEKNFSSSAHCLRGDVADMFGGIYSRSELESNVNASSEEIRSFLAEAGYPLKMLEGFGNVKFFGVSLFSNSRALYHRSGTDGGAEENRQLFKVSPKRMELPVLWMFHNFGLIR